MLCGYGQTFKRTIGVIISVCVCVVCVCERESESEDKKQNEAAKLVIVKIQQSSFIPMTQIIHNIHLSQMFYVKSIHMNNVHWLMGDINLLSLCVWGLLIEIKGFSGKDKVVFNVFLLPIDIQKKMSPPVVMKHILSFY